MFLILVLLTVAPARAYVTLITDGGLNAWNDTYTPTYWSKLYSENYKIFRTTYPRLEGTYAAVIDSQDASDCRAVHNGYYQYLTQIFSKNVQASNGQWLDARAKIYKDPNRQNCQVLYLRGHDASRGITWYTEIWLDTITNNVRIGWYDPSTGSYYYDNKAITITNGWHDLEIYINFYSTTITFNFYYDSALVNNAKTVQKGGVDYMYQIIIGDPDGTYGGYAVWDAVVAQSNF